MVVESISGVEEAFGEPTVKIPLEGKSSNGGSWRTKGPSEISKYILPKPLTEFIKSKGLGITNNNNVHICFCKEIYYLFVNLKTDVWTTF